MERNLDGGRAEELDSLGVVLVFLFPLWMPLCSKYRTRTLSRRLDRPICGHMNNVFGKGKRIVVFVNVARGDLSGTYVKDRIAGTSQL